MPAPFPLAGITLDCPDPEALAAFYRAATGWQTVYATDDYTDLAAEPDAQKVQVQLGFPRAPDLEAPEWPLRRRQSHLGLAVDNLDAAEQELVALGATRPAHQPGGGTYRVLADPVGHTFYLFVW